MKKIILLLTFAFAFVATNAQKAITPPLTWEKTPSGITWHFDTAGVNMGNICNGYIQETIAPYSKIASFTCNSTACPVVSGTMYSYIDPLSNPEYVGSCDVHQIFPSTGVHTLKCYILMRGEAQFRTQTVTIDFGGSGSGTVTPINPSTKTKGNSGK